MEEPGRLWSMGSLKVGHDWATSLSLFTFHAIGEGNGNPLQCSCLENPKDGGAWWAAVYGVAQSQTRQKWLSSSSGCDGITVELFKTQRMMQSICCIQYFSKSGRPGSGHRSRKGQFSFQFPKRVVLKNVLTIGQLHVRLCLKSCMLGFSIMWTMNLQMSKMGLEKEEEPEINKLLTSNYQHLLDHRES